MRLKGVGGVGRVKKVDRKRQRNYLERVREPRQIFNPLLERHRGHVSRISPRPAKKLHLPSVAIPIIDLSNYQRRTSLLH